MEGSNLFDNNIRSRFQGFSPEPPAEAWLFVKDAIVVAPRPNMMLVYSRVAAAIAFLAISSLTVWFITSDRHTSVPLADVHTASDMAPAVTPEITPADNGLLTPETGLPAAFASTSSQLASITPAIISSSVDPGKDQTLSFSDRSIPAPSLLSGLQARAITWSPPSEVTPIYAHQHHSGISSQFFAIQANKESLFANATPSSRTTGFSLGMHIAPRYNDRHIAEPGSLMTSGDPFSVHEQTIMSYGYGLSAAIQLTPRLSLQTGAAYSSMSQMVQNINAYAHFDNRPFYDPGSDIGYTHPQNIVTSLGVIEVKTPSLYFTDDLSERVLTNNESKFPLDLPEDPKLLDLQSQQLTQAFSFIEVPLIARYHILDNRYIGLYVKAGVAGNFLLSNTVLLSYANSGSQEVIGQTAGVRSFSYSGIGGFGMAIPLTNRLKLFVEPTAQMFLQPILKDEMASSAGKAYPYSFSIASGLSFRF